MIIPYGLSKNYYDARGQLYLDMMNTIPEDNTNVMRIFAYEVNQQARVFCLLQEYIQGETMTDYLIEEVFTQLESSSWMNEKKQKEIKKNKKLLFFKLLDCMMDSITTINSRGYYHIDVKGDNFMVDTTQSCKIIDFDSTVNVMTDLSTVNVAFTKKYAAPEVVYHILMKFCGYSESYICDLPYATDNWIDRNFYTGESLSNSDPFAIGIIIYQTLFNSDNPFYLERELDNYCNTNDLSYHECNIGYLASIYHKISKNIYNKSSFNYEFITTLVGSRVIPDNFYEVMNRYYTRYGNGKYNIDFSKEELNALFFIMSRCLMINPDYRLTMTEAKYLLEETVLRLNK